MDMRRHIEACSGWLPPGGRRRLVLGGVPVGWADVPGQGELALPDAPALAALEARLAAAGRFVPRGERFDVWGDDGGLDAGPALATVDRAVLPVLGIRAFGVHMNGLVRRPGGVHVWIARRSMAKRLDPGKLDHLVGGGVAAGMGFDDTLVKEAEEEAGLPAAVTAGAVRVGTLAYAVARAEGLRRDVLACYDLWLPDTFRPVAVDGEVSGFELWPLHEAVDRVRRTDDFKFNDTLVLIDLFLRLRALPDAEAAELHEAMRRVRAQGQVRAQGHVRT